MKRQISTKISTICVSFFAALTFCFLRMLHEENTDYKDLKNNEISTSIPKECSNLTEEKKNQEAWSRFLDEGIKRELNEKEVINTLKKEGFEIVGERTHYSARLPAKKIQCYNKIIVFRIYFKKGRIDRYDSSLGVVLID